jgi:NhaP-type Na+/H+ or K+/H+ antiporter
MTRRYAPAFLGGIGLVSTFVALLLANLLTDGLQISGAVTWVLATLVVWLVTALGTLLLPLLLLKKATSGNGPAARR